MNRKTNKKQIVGLLKKIRNKIPNCTLRTSLIVGFPGETKEQYEELEEFIKIARFDKLGAFQYSKEDGTPAAKLPNQIHGNTKKARYNKIMKTQQEISREKLEEKLNKEFEILIEDISFDGRFYIGRTIQDAPDIDGLVYIKNNSKNSKESKLNKFEKCKIIGISDYDLIGEFIN